MFHTMIEACKRKLPYLSVPLFFIAMSFALPASAGLLYYDGFDYSTTPSPQQLIGKTNIDYSKTWTQPSAPANNRQTVVSGNLTFPGLPTSTGNLVLNPRGSAAQNGLARIDIPGAPYTSGSLFFSFVMKATTWANLNYSQTTTAPNLAGGWLAGFHYGQGADPASLVPPYAYQLKTLRVADTTISPTANQPQRYYLGVIKKGSSGDATSPPRSWDLTQSFGLNDVVFVVGEYKFNTGSTTDDVASLWINPVPGDLSAYASPTVVSPVDADVSPAEIKSFYFAANTYTPGDFQMDELRIGITYADVTPAIPEPGSLVLCLTAISFCGQQRSRRRK